MDRHAIPWPHFSTLNCSFLPQKNLTPSPRFLNFRQLPLPPSSTSTIPYFLHTFSTSTSPLLSTLSTYHCTIMSSQALTVWSPDPSQLTSEGDIAEEEPLSEPLYQHPVHEPSYEQQDHHYASSPQYIAQSGMFYSLLIRLWSECLNTVPVNFAQLSTSRFDTG